MPRPFIPAPNTASVEFIWSINGVVCENQIHVQKGSPYSLADLQAVRAICNTWDSATWAPIRCAASTLSRIRTRALDSATSPVEDFSLATPRIGGTGAICMPNNVAFCVKLATTTPGRSYRGRWYVTAISPAGLAANTNQLNAGTVTFYVASLNTLMANLAASGHIVSVVSYRGDN